MYWWDLQIKKDLRITIFISHNINLRYGIFCIKNIFWSYVFKNKDHGNTRYYFNLLLARACYQIKPCNWFCPVGFCKSGTETKKLPLRKIVFVWTFLFHKYLAKLDWRKRLAFCNLQHIFTYYQSILPRLMRWGIKIFRINPLWN